MCSLIVEVLGQEAELMKINEIMTRNVECVSPSLKISLAAEKMLNEDIGFLPICEHDKVVGTVTDRDITIRSVAQGRDPRLAPKFEGQLLCLDLSIIPSCLQ